ncbi:IS1249 family transposase, partial [Sinomonas sp. ASV322]|uniref:IS1249 family transposase n=1 Tax=Sinomonas sp. ASV322 TaxID=3041920 RepID=UPI0027DCEBE3
LIATAGEHVIGWQWCDTEKSAAWAALLERFPAPRVVVCDGGAGLASALRKVWPETRVQRCLVHVHRNVRTHLTHRPRLEAGRALLRLSKALMRLKTAEEAAAWATALNDWHTRWGPMLKQRTHRGEAGAAPSWVKPSQQWWYTHKRLRAAYYLLERLVKAGTLFTHLAPEHEDLRIASTTNRIEGGVNAQLRLLLKHHRGMSQNHMKRAVEWWLYTHSENPAPAHKLIRPEHREPPKRTPTTTEEERIGPALYDTATTAEEGLWARTGRAGRSR